jgi:hypothetical protein
MPVDRAVEAIDRGMVVFELALGLGRRARR